MTGDNIMQTLTTRQQQVYTFIKEYIETNECPPTLREISAHIGTAGTVTAISHVEALEKKQRPPCPQTGCCGHHDALAKEAKGEKA